MSIPELSIAQGTPDEDAPRAAVRGVAWLRAAQRARLLAWVSLAWTSVEGLVGVLAGVQAHSLGVVTWAASSFVEALASLIVVWRFTGRRTLSATSEARAQRWVAASFFVLAPYLVIEAIRKLINGGHTNVTILAVALTVSAIALMPLLCALGASLSRERPRARASRTSCARSRPPWRWRRSPALGSGCHGLTLSRRSRSPRSPSRKAATAGAENRLAARRCPDPPPTPLTRTVASRC